MSALAIPAEDLERSRRERLAGLLSATADGIAGRAEGCRACQGGECPECGQARRDIAALGQAAAGAQDAGTWVEALRAYVDCFTALSGAALAVDVMSLAACCGTGGAL